MIDLRSQKSYDCNDLRKIVHILRSPGGCQWDQAQTHQSIRRNFLEEAYEVAEAVGYKNPNYFGAMFKRYNGYTPKEYREASYEDKN